MDYIHLAGPIRHGSCVVYEPLDRYVDRHNDRYVGRHIGRDVGRHVDRHIGRHVDRYVGQHSTDTSVDIGADTRPNFSPLNIGRVSVVYRSTVGGLSVDCLII